MFKLHFWLLTLLASICWLATPNVVFAAADDYEQHIPAATNIGDFIYEDQEYLTQEQVDTINAMNRKNIARNDHQYLTLIILNKIPLEEYPNTSDEQSREFFLNTLQEKFHEEDDNRYNDIARSQHNQRLRDGRNFLLVSIQDRKTYFFGDYQMEQYLTDYKIWKMLLPINFGIQPADTDKQVTDTIKLMKKINTTIGPISRFDDNYQHSTSFQDLRKKVWYVSYAIKAFFMIMIVGTILAIFLAIIFSPSSLSTYYIFSRFYRDWDKKIPLIIWSEEFLLFPIPF